MRRLGCRIDVVVRRYIHVRRRYERIRRRHHTFRSRGWHLLPLHHASLVVQRSLRRHAGLRVWRISFLRVSVIAHRHVFTFARRRTMLASLRPLPLPFIVEVAFSHVLLHAGAYFLVASPRIQRARAHLCFEIVAENFSHAVGRNGRHALPEWPAMFLLSHHFLETPRYDLAQLWAHESLSILDARKRLASDSVLNACAHLLRRLLQRPVRLFPSLLHPLLILRRHQIVFNCKCNAFFSMRLVLTIRLACASDASPCASVRATMRASRSPSDDIMSFASANARHSLMWATFSQYA